MRDAAIMAFGSILEGPNTDALKPFVESAMPFIIELLRDPVSAVRDSAAWTIGRVCDLLPEVALAEVYLVPLLTGLFEGLTAEPRVAANVCWAFKSLADGAYDVAVNEHVDTSNDGDDEPSTYALSRYFDTISLQLLEASNRADGAQHSLRNAAYSALMALIRSAARDCYSHVQGVTLIVLERLETILGYECHIINTMDRAQFNDLQSLLCATLQSVLKKINKEDAPSISNKVMSALMSMFHSVVGVQDNAKSPLCKTDGVVEDALLAVSALIDVIGELFLKYLDAFMPVLVACLRLCEETQVCLNAVGLLGDMCRTLGRNMFPQSEGLFNILMETLQNASADKSIRPAILSTFGDLALALGPDIRPFLFLILDTLKQATQAEVNLADPDMIEYLNSLRLSCLEAYTGIVQCLKYSGNGYAETTKALFFIINDHH
ncbi:unnamed protein product [Protopolystoma xenopodis]|uniref:Importin subunit beta-1/Transportin-1-like TPR repeats domain-containing protein n=1 Tax=Protopolystoma xenopodis TaxID=117903 RepID=A0A3S5AFB8_9PLAT|nr:unnamed protein product [Protopolystoma xenopodis]